MAAAQEHKHSTGLLQLDWRVWAVRKGMDPGGFSREEEEGAAKLHRVVGVKVDGVLGAFRLFEVVEKGEKGSGKWEKVVKDKYAVLQVKSGRVVVWGLGSLKLAVEMAEAVLDETAGVEWDWEYEEYLRKSFQERLKVVEGIRVAMRMFPGAKTAMGGDGGREKREKGERGERGEKVGSGLKPFIRPERTVCHFCDAGVPVTGVGKERVHRMACGEVPCYLAILQQYGESRE